MARTRAELAARLREGYEANNFGPVLDVLAELEAPEATPVHPGSGADLQVGSAAAHEAESCGDPALGELDEHQRALEEEAAERAEHAAEEDHADDEDDPFGGGGFGLPDRAHEDGEASPGLHHRSRVPKRPVRKKR